MPISKDLLDILVCPFDKAELEMKPDQSGLNRRIDLQARFTF